MDVNASSVTLDADASVAVSQPSQPNSEKLKWAEDQFSTLTIEECEQLFNDQYEDNIDQFIESYDKLSILRSCIELLNRLENTQHDRFAGRVLVFLAKAIPLYDPSGINLRSEFNQRDLPENVRRNLQQICAQNAEKTRQLSKLIDQDIEEGETISDDESNDSSSMEDADKFYERFWKVQQLLLNPNLLYDKNNWFAFRTHVDAMLKKLEEKPATIKVWNLRSNYMTDSKSLSLQIGDVNMRRCFLVQILIILQYLDSPVEMRPDSLTADKVQIAWSQAATKKIYDLLDSTANHDEGRKFLGYVRHILKREEMWSRWKNEKCKEPTKPEEEDDFVNMRGTYHKRRKISDELASAKAYNMHVIGSQDMTRLWNMKTKPRTFSTPDLGKYLNIAPEKQAECFKDANYSFRSLRLLRKSPHFFSPSSTVIQNLDEYLKSASARYLNAMKPAVRNNPNNHASITANPPTKSNPEANSALVDVKPAIASKTELPADVNSNQNITD